jgi:hypothetical protein
MSTAHATAQDAAASRIYGVAARGNVRRTLLASPLVWLVPLAIAFRLIMFLGRGDYIAFDEGWYLLLARNLADGNGFSLAGLRHVALSPLFPIAVAGVDAIVGNIVWSGRVVAAIAGGLVVAPAWYIARRLTGRRTALLAAAMIAVMPALAPFVVPYWIGWDLWAGAEPLLHLMLYAGIALAVRLDRGTWRVGWLGVGALLSLAYLARPEAILAATVLGLLLCVRALLRMNARELLLPFLFAIGFVSVAAPYWLYLHDALGRWTLTGRAVQLPSILPPASEAGDGAVRAPSVSAAGTIEQMLWRGDRTDYVRNLFSLHPDGTRLASTYWGVPSMGSTESDARQDADDAPALPEVPAVTGSAATQPDSVNPRLSRVRYYARAIGFIVPWYLWPFVALAALRRRRTTFRETAVVLPLLLTSPAVAWIVAADPRTQTFLLPLLAIYAAIGIRFFGLLLDRVGRRSANRPLRRGFGGTLAAAIVLILLAGTCARQLYMSLAVGSPHHLVGAENRRVAASVSELVPHEEPVMSWHPAVALFAGRDWRVLPHADLARVLTYASAVDTRTIVLSAYYPAPVQMDNVPGRYLILHVSEAAPGTRDWQLQPLGEADPYLRMRATPAN